MYMKRKMTPKKDLREERGVSSSRKKIEKEKRETEKREIKRNNIFFFFSKEGVGKSMCVKRKMTPKKDLRKRERESQLLSEEERKR